VRIAINGAGIAGPTLAYWLCESGHEVLLVEQAPQLPRGGYVIDFWGPGYDVAEKMGLIPRIREVGYQVEEVRFVDRRGWKNGGFSADVFERMTAGRFTSLRRSDLAATIYHALDGNVETIFGDSIASIEDDGRCLRFGLEHSTPREADLVVGADGLHSRVRHLVFGAEGDFEVPLGYHVAAFEVDGYRPRDELAYVSHSIPGRQVSRFSMRDDKTLFLFVFRDKYLPEASLASEQEYATALQHVFADAGWECPRILASIEDATGIYFDRVSQIRMDSWTRGRVALVGDAAACVSLLGGEGTGLAMTEGYVLAGELHAAGNNTAVALARYEERMLPFLKRKQASAMRFASAFAPRTRAGIAFRNIITLLLEIPALADYVIGRDLRDDFRLPEYRLR
jgi:2-polyprenyl-6-methoxyphenol hydroxylase-like FAD-dependent oxidoreductase